LNKPFKAASPSGFSLSSSLLISAPILFQSFFELYALAFSYALSNLGY